MAARILDFFDFNDAPRQECDREKLSASIPESEFTRAILARGFDHPGNIVDTGKIVRWGRNKEFWYRYFSDSIPGGAFGSWKEGGESYSWCAMSELEMSPAELHAYRARTDRIRFERQEAEEKTRAAAAARAEADWAKAEPLGVHPYLVAKGVQAHGTRLLNGKVLIPAFSVETGQITTYQTIKDTSKEGKKFIPDGKVKGACYTIQGSETVGIAEGFATAATVHEIMGWTMLVAFDAGNLKEVARLYRQKHPTAKIVICADNDIGTGKNTGREAAESVAQEIGARIALPEMDGQKADWNDLAVAKGADEVRRQLSNCTARRVDIMAWSASRYRGVQAPAKEWVVEHTLPKGDAVIMAGMGGCGKGMISLDLGLQVASPAPSGFLDLSQPSAFGNRIVSHGRVVIITAEDDNDEVHRRIESLGRSIPDDLFILPLPDITGPMPLVVPGRNGPEVTAAWHDLREQLVEIKPVLINIDPMASFVMADINADPAVGQFTMGLLAHLGKQTGASMLIAHHLAKTNMKVDTPEAARSLIRGTTAIVDGARGAYVLWAAQEGESKTICKALELQWERGRVFKGCLVKNNFRGDGSVKTYVRSSRGVLEVFDQQIRQAVEGSTPAQMDILCDFLTRQANAGKPFTKTGSRGLFENIDILPEALQGLSRKVLRTLADNLIQSGRIEKSSKGENKALDFLVGAGSHAARNGVDIVPGSLRINSDDYADDDQKS